MMKRHDSNSSESGSDISTKQLRTQYDKFALTVPPSSATAGSVQARFWRMVRVAPGTQPAIATVKAAEVYRRFLFLA